MSLKIACTGTMHVYHAWCITYIIIHYIITLYITSFPPYMCHHPTKRILPVYWGLSLLFRKISDWRAIPTEVSY